MPIIGHFGRSPIRTAWLGFVLPALALNYLGQGAMLLAHPERLENPFFLLYPSWALLPMVILATVATIIASQAVITGAFSISQQAMQLGVLPRFRVLRTSETEKGQIYIPIINWLLLAAVIVLVVLFKSSSALAAAYGIAVTGDMVITSCLLFIVAWKFWRWSPAVAALVIAPFLAIELDLPRRERAQDPAGRLVPAAGRRRAVHPDVDLAQGHAPAGRDLAPGPPAAGRVHPHGREQLGAAGAGHGHVPDRQRPGCAGRPAAQPEAQQGAA